MSVFTSDPIKGTVSVFTSDPMKGTLSVFTSNPIKGTVSVFTSDHINGTLSVFTSNPIKGTVSVFTSDPIKGTVSVFTCDPLCKDENFRKSTSSLKPLYDQWGGRYGCFSVFKVFNSDNSYMLSCSRNARVTFVEKIQF